MIHRHLNKKIINIILQTNLLSLFFFQLKKIIVWRKIHTCACHIFTKHITGLTY
jgi:hypothetical protein